MIDIHIEFIAVANDPRVAAPPLMKVRVEQDGRALAVEPISLADLKQCRDKLNEAIEIAETVKTHRG
jgi:hypothetical protein